MAHGQLAYLLVLAAVHKFVRHFIFVFGKFALFSILAPIAICVNGLVEVLIPLLGQHLQAVRHEKFLFLPELVLVF
jgi:hypothetical protein